MMALLLNPLSQVGLVSAVLVRYGCGAVANDVEIARRTGRRTCCHDIERLLLRRFATCAEGLKFKKGTP